MRTLFKLLESLTLCIARVVIINPFKPKFCLSGVLGELEQSSGGMFKQGFIKDIRLFGKRPGRLIFFGFKPTYTYAAPTYLGSCILFLFKCVLADPDPDPDSLSGSFYVSVGRLSTYTTTLFKRISRITKRKDEMPMGKFSERCS